MASNTRNAIRQAEQKRQAYYEDYLARFLTLFHNSVKVMGTEVPKRYLLSVLLEHGAIAYDYETNLFLRYVASGIDVYGLPERYQLIGANGYAVLREPYQVCILRANDKRYPFYQYYDLQAQKLADFDMAIAQNMEAIKTMTIAEVENDSQLLSMANNLYARQIGATVVVTNKKLGVGNSINVQSTGAQYYIDKLLQDRKEILNETLSTIGGVNANTSKRERVQGAEVSASNGFAIDCLNTLVDTFNYDAEKGDLLIRLETNTSLGELEQQEQENNGENIKDTE